ncbi:hypothetical protein BX600DRAFT_466878 [Xylariales sp. PMI_506]|nr:hypothetical protein BX600DRAFT_466878 [Xylariales sp. PMI_506]
MHCLCYWILPLVSCSANWSAIFRGLAAELPMQIGFTPDCSAMITSCNHCVTTKNGTAAEWHCMRNDVFRDIALYLVI